MLCTATDVGIYGLLASQSCYHSMLAPCWFTLWNGMEWNGMEWPIKRINNGKERPIKLDLTFLEYFSQYL